MPAEQARRFRVGEVPPLAEGFIDRPDTAGGLADVLVPGSAVALVPDPAVAETLPNWSGACGKTQIAAMIAESLWRSRIIDGLIWISVTNRAAVLSGFMQASVVATGLEPTGTADSVAVRFVSWLGETRQPWLVVLDDVPETVNLAGLWPDGSAGRLLITSSRAASALGRPGTRVIPVGSFSTREALTGLSERLIANPVQRQGAIDLAETLGREPLALGQASAVIASSNLTCRDYRELFIQRRDQIWTSADEIPSAAMVTWILCLERAESLLPSSAVRLMLVFLALLDGHGIPGAVFGAQALIAYLGGAATPFSAAADPRQVWDVLLALEQAGLIGINRDVTPPTALVSSALQAAIRLAAPAEVQEPAARAAASALLEVWPADEPSPWAAASLRANMACLQDSAPDSVWADGCHPLLARVGRSLDEARLTGPAVEFWQDLAARCDAKLPPGHPDAQVVAGQLAAAYLAAGNAAEAVQWYQRVLADWTRELTPGHPAIVAARVSLARSLIMAGEPGDAVTVMLRVAAEYEQSRGDGHPETLSARDELATAYQAAGDYAAAGRLLARSLADRERLHGPRDPLTIATRERLAAAWLADGKVKDALSQYKRVLSDHEKILGRGHLATIATVAGLSAAYQAAGRMPAAMQYAERCCADSERVLGRDHADTLTRLANLARLYYAVGRVGDAETLLREAATRCERTLPPGHPLTEVVQQSLASIGER
ncbi:MAG TPA: tetratricopeptide repeat protein [Streptosporangiaceae bacterium]|nr:tetratricopeptide repeat protein [Streptosporangiaceae bacterium]